MLRASSVLLVVIALAACGDDEGSALSPDTSGTSFDATNFTDTTTTATSTDISATSDSAIPDSIEEDTSLPDTRLPETTAPLTTLKDDPTFLVPGNIAAKTEIAAFGTTVAWVEEPADGPPFLVVWETTAPDGDGVDTYFVPNLTRPRQLALSDELLVYVDDRYGDPDVFAVDRATGEALTIAALRGAQEQPTVAGRRVAWADCRACVTGDDGTGWEIYTRLGTAPETRASDDATPDRRPTFGALEGEPVLAWISGRTSLRVVAHTTLDGGAGRDQTFDVASELRASETVGWLAVTPGALAYRTRPLIVNPDSMIVNPDSMYPSDVIVQAIAGDVLGPTTRLVRHGELRGGVDGRLAAAGPYLAWIQSAPGPGNTAAVDTLVLTQDLVTIERIQVSGLQTLGLGQSVLAFIAPRADNDGLPDAWVLPLD